VTLPPALRRRLNRRTARLGAVVAAGGGIGAAARGWVEDTWPPSPGAFPTTTLVVNASGCLAMGVLMVLLENTLRGRVYTRPFLGIGFLGGFTTFSLVADETRALFDDRPALALSYFVGTAVVAVVATAAGFALSSAVLTPRAVPAEPRTSVEAYPPVAP
jgi:CrcB protein